MLSLHIVVIGWPASAVLKKKVILTGDYSLVPNKWGWGGVGVGVGGEGGTLGEIKQAGGRVGTFYKIKRK